MPVLQHTAYPSEAVVPTDARQRYYPALDGLRGIAILAVFFSHFNGGHTSGGLMLHMLAGVTDAGWMGVDLFFVLSGFLITGILYDTAKRPHRARNFYARRALRIFPIFYGVLGCFLLLTPVLHLHWRPGHLLYLVYLSNMMTILAPHLSPPGVGVDLVHLWSLAVEEQFYLLWPFVIWSIRDRVKLLRVCVVVAASVLLLRCVLVAIGVAPGILYQLLPTRADSLLCGAALALMVRGPGGRSLRSRWIPLLSGGATLAIFLIDGNGGHEARLMSTIGYSLIAILCGCLVLGAQQDRGWITWLCDHAALRFVGRYSYGLYLYHGVLLVYLVGWLAPLQRLTGSTAGGGVLYLLLSFGFCMSVAMLSYHLVEAPILKWKRRFA